MLEIERSEAKKRELREELEAARREDQTCRNEFTAKAVLENKLAEKAYRCQALRKEMEEEIYTSQAKYKNQICMLKDEIERGKADLQHSYELLVRQKDDLDGMDEELA
ncbi:hypothetical protein ACOSP7_016809 [Xanthoceras sorbifolium]